MAKKSIDIYYLAESKTWSCLASITPLSLKEEIEALMSGYDIIRDRVDADTSLYSGNFDSKDWFQAIFRMHGFMINITIE